jgi:hypothetical protein
MLWRHIGLLSRRAFLHSCTTGRYDANAFTEFISTSIEKTISVVLAEHRTALWWWFLRETKHFGASVITFKLF